MKEPGEELDPHWDGQVNALMDGELGAAEMAALELAARDNPDLARAIEDARDLQQLLGVMPQAKAPRQLRRKLLAISRPPGLLSLVHWPWLRGGVVLASLALVVLVLYPGDSGRPSTAEIDQGRRELALALSYLSEASHKANLQISRRIGGALVDPVTHTTARALSLESILPPVIQQEYEL